MIIDPHEAVIAWLRSDDSLIELTGTQIAAKHRFGTAGPNASWVPWTIETPALGVYLDGGTPDIYTPIQEIRVECRCYADSQYKAMVIWRRLAELTRVTGREAVETLDGTALVHNFLQASGPSLVWDDVLHMDICIGFFSAIVGETAIA